MQDKITMLKIDHSSFYIVQSSDIQEIQ